MGLLIMIVIFLALWKILGTLGHIFLPILAVLFILATWIPSQAIVMVIWVPIAILYFIGLAGYKHAKQNQYKYILIGGKSWNCMQERTAHTCSTLPLQLASFASQRQSPFQLTGFKSESSTIAHYQPSGQHASVVQRQNNVPIHFSLILMSIDAGSTPAARVVTKKHIPSGQEDGCA